MQITSRVTTRFISLCCGLASILAAGCSGTSDGAPVQVAPADDLAPRCFAKDLTDEFGLGDCNQGHSTAAGQGGGGDDGDLFDGLGEGGKDGSWTKNNPQPKSAGKAEAPGGDCADSCKDEAEACVSACDSAKSLVNSTIGSCKAQCAARHGRCMITCLGRNGLP